jgi:hypothetical protein
MNNGPRGEDEVPLWNWYETRVGAIYRVRAMHMNKDFTYQTDWGLLRGLAGDWLIESEDGVSMGALTDDSFRELYELLDPTRRETIVQPDSVAPPKPPAPDTEVL